ncbi:MAG: acyl-CoA thioesterase [Oscillospiraceae bacterium]
MPSYSEIVVRYAETDCMGIVHHSVYPVWFEVARTDYIKSVGMSYADMEKSGVMLPVTGITCRYHLPARYDDTLVVQTTVSRLTQARIEFSYAVRKKDSGELLCEGTSAHGFVDAQSFRPISLKKTMPEMYLRIESEYLKDSGN